MYNNLPQLVEKDLKKLTLCPPISISNTSDPCQDIPELRAELKKLILLLMNYGVSFSITTKGDPSFLLDVPGFTQYEPKFIGITIEGNADILQLISPMAPPFESRVKTVRKLSQAGIQTLIRLDPVFIHLFKALYANSWFKEIEKIIDIFADTGAKHVVSSTGRLSKRKPKAILENSGKSSWERILEVIRANSAEAAEEFQREYCYERGGTSHG